MRSQGLVARVKGIEMPKGDFSNDDDWINPHALGRKLNIARCMVQEVMFENDEAAGYYSRQNETPEQRWGRMRGWVASQIKPGDA